jgi:hypothetical protein
MRNRIRFLKLDRGNRTAPLNFGFENALGDYVAILDDDDLVFAHWVEAFKSLAGKNPGRVLRVTPIAQTSKYAQLKTTDLSATYAVDSPSKKFPSAFDPLDHHLENKTPPVALAFPRSAFADLSLKFDESLTTTEDWDYLMRVSNLTGVASSPEICALYRMWKDAESSYTVHTSEEWQKNHFDIWKKLDSTPLLLPAGQLSRIREIMRSQSNLQTNLGQHDEARTAPDDHFQFVDADPTPPDRRVARAQTRAAATAAMAHGLRGHARSQESHAIDLVMEIDGSAAWSTPIATMTSTICLHAAAASHTPNT